MFAWTSKGPKVFKSIPPELFDQTKTLAANQGLYNGFLAAGLIWGICISNEDWSRNVSLFFLACVIIAGIYGALSAHRSIFYKQALPAILVAVLVWLF
jgi:putative membrane protein